MLVFVTRAASFAGDALSTPVLFVMSTGKLETAPSPSTLRRGPPEIVVRDAVLSEPVSPPNSLLYGNLQGIFRNLGDLLRCTRSQGPEFPELFRDIPYSKEQGIFQNNRENISRNRVTRTSIRDVTFWGKPAQQLILAPTLLGTCCSSGDEWFGSSCA